MQQLWHRASFNILLDNPVQWARVDGIVMSDAPTLGLHIDVTHFVDVTHLPTGKAVGHFRTLGAAMEFVHRIAYLLDWATLPPEPQALAQVAQLRAAVAATEQFPHVVPL